MSDSDPNSSKKRPQPPAPERFQPKVLAIWVVIFATLILLWSLSSPGQSSKNEVDLDGVMAALNDGRLESIQIKALPSGGPDFFEISGVMRPLHPSDSTGPTVSFKTGGYLKGERFEALTGAGEKGVKVTQLPASTLLSDILVSLLPLLIIIGLIYFLFIRQLRMAGKGAMTFGKSRAKLLTREKEQVSFKDVAGCDEAKEDVAEIVDFLKDPKRFQKIGGRVPKGVLMVGPPGTGKTLLARAVAGEADVPFFSISGSDFVEMFVGVGAARVRDMFEQGRRSAPCIIFVDEIDAVGRQRGAGLGGGNDEREQTLNSLLVEMDGFEGHEGIIIIAATNRPDVLDSALLRPGRFDRQILIDLPDVAGREEILKVHARKIKMAKEIDMGLIARNTPGYSGADLANLLNEGALIAARYKKKEVEYRDIDEARDKISFGRERRRLMDDEDRKITAYHEAGHALVQAVIDDGQLPVHKVTIIPRGHSLGSTMFSPTKDFLNYAKRRVLNQVCCAMGGRVAEELIFGDITSGAAGDIKMATKLVRHMVCDWGMSPLGPVAFGENQDHIFLGKEISRNQNYSERTARMIDDEIHRVVMEQHDRAFEIVKEKRDALEAIAEALLEHETIEGKHIHEIIDHGSLRSPVTSTVQTIAKEEPDADKEKSKSRKPGEEMGPGTEPAGAPA